MSSFLSTFTCECGKVYGVVVGESIKQPPAPSERPSVTEVEVAVKDYANLVEVSQSGTNGKIVVSKKVRWINPKDWDEIDKLLRKFDNSVWITDGENSRWEI